MHSILQNTKQACIIAVKNNYMLSETKKVKRGAAYETLNPKVALGAAYNLMMEQKKQLSGTKQWSQKYNHLINIIQHKLCE